ncbi:MAG: hypothetical protein MRY83_21305, partial [Flavobacteriales bacterium]|nr:hypothetical protein [Flavobacteriales bacterium]
NKHFAKEKGEYYSQMKFKDFIKSDLFKQGVRFYLKKLMTLFVSVIVTSIIVLLCALISPMLGLIVFLFSVLIIIAIMTISENIFTKKSNFKKQK